MADREALFVDGYNVINAWPELKALPLAHARDALYERLVDYAHYRELELFLVFDAHMQNTPENIEEGVGTVVYTAAGETADRFIERNVRELYREGRSISVATSDGLEQVMIMGYARRISARELIMDIKAAREEYIKEYISPKAPRRNQLEGRLREDHLAAFERMRRE